MTRRWINIKDADGSSPATIYTITAGPLNSWLIGSNQGVWRFVPEMGTYQNVSAALNQVAITGLAYSKRLVMVGAADGLALSVDGESWQQAELPKQTAVTQIALTSYFDQTGIAYAVTLEDGLMRSMDIGRSWATCNFGLIDKEAVAIALSADFPNDMTILAAFSTGLFKTSNMGSAWRELNIDAEAMPMACLAMTLNVALAGSETHGLFYSTDKGESWFKRGTFVSGPISALASSPDGNTLALATPQVVATSTDLGETWTRTEGKTPKNIIALSVADDGMVVCGTQQDGLWVY